MRGRSLRYNQKGAEAIYKAIKGAGIDFVTYLPDSWLREVNRLLAKDKDIEHILATREDEALAIACGGYIAGRKTAVLMEGSGWGLVGLVIARIAYLHHVASLIISTHTGGEGEFAYYHSESRYLVEPTLKAFNIPYRVLDRIEDASSVILRSQWAIEMQKVPIALILPGHILWEGYDEAD